jgi:hypothetical protein
VCDFAGNIRAICRVRPILPVEIASGQMVDVTEIPTPDDIVISK